MNDLTEELNTRLYNRYFSGDRYSYSINKVNGLNIVEPVSDCIPFRPTATKYTKMLVLDADTKRETSDINIKHNKSKQYQNYIDTESNLRNQFFALQNNIKSKWIPSSNSDLYSLNIEEQNIDIKEKQPYPRLFHKEIFSAFDTNPHKLGHNIWNNYTQLQVKELKTVQ